MNKVLSNDIVKYLEERLKNCQNYYADLLNDLKKKYRALDFALICNYILENKADEKLLNQTIRVIISNKYIDNFDSILKFLDKTQNVELKVLAIKALSFYKNTKAVPMLLKCLKDKNSNYKVRFSAADALGKIGDKNAFDVLRTVVCDEDEKSSYVKESAVVALGNLGDNRAIDVFSSILSSKQMFLEKFTFLKERVIEAISKLDLKKDERAIEILKQTLLESSPRLRISAIEAIMNIESKESYDLIYDRLLYDDDIEVRKNALIALYNLSDRKILDNVLDGDFPFELKEIAKDIISEYEDKNE